MAIPKCTSVRHGLWGKQNGEIESVDIKIFKRFKECTLTERIKRDENKRRTEDEETGQHHRKLLK